MSTRRLWAVARKEFLHVIRDPLSLAMAIAMPLLLMMLYGYALSLDVDNVPTVVWDQSESPASREFISAFNGSRYFSIRAHVRNYREVEEAVDSGRALVAVIVPRDFAGRIESGREAVVQLIVDGSDSNTATLAMGYADVVTLTYAQKVGVRLVGRTGMPPPRPALDFRPRVWFNEEMESRNYIIPGLIAVIMMVIAALLTSLTVAREWERGTMEQLISTPVKGPELIMGKLLPYFAIGMFDVLLVVLLGQFLFRVPLRGNVVLLFGMAAIFLAGTLSLGILVSVVTKSQLLASQFSMVLTFVPSFLMSGFVFAISNMPEPMQWVTYAVPARYFITMLKAIYLKGVGLQVLAGDAVLLTVYGMVMVLLANLMFKKKLV